MLKASFLTVYFDGSCPLCAKEIQIYQGRVKPGLVNWMDVSAQDFDPPEGKSVDELMARFHVRTIKGQWLIGAPGFIALWRVTPGFRILGYLTSIPPAPQILDLGYRGFLKIRPRLQKLIRRP
jgi:predicted DCC family thiol-disulfide oxidoreductase YuxK